MAPAKSESAVTPDGAASPKWLSQRLGHFLYEDYCQAIELCLWIPAASGFSSGSGAHFFLFPCLQKHWCVCSRLNKCVKSIWVAVRGQYHSFEDVWMSKLFSTGTGSSEEIQPQGNFIFVCPLPLPVEGLIPLFHVYDSWFLSFT